MKVFLDQEIELEIERLGIYGEGVGYLESLTIFVEDALPQEKILAKVTERRRTFARAKVLNILEVSPHRVKPICPLFGSCGGCQVMHLDYNFQRQAKRQRVIDALERIGKLQGVEVLPCRPSPKPLCYRNKIQLLVGKDMSLGLYARNTHDLIPIDTCFIHCLLGEKAFQAIRKIVKKHALEGQLKHILIKTAVNTQEVLVVLVTWTEEPLQTLAKEIMQAVPEIKGVVQNVHPDKSNVVLSRDFRILEGQGSIKEVIHGLTFKVSPASFFQVNPEQAENLYATVVKWAALEGKETVLDAYCGVGTLSLILAKNARQVIGVEVVEDAIKDAKENADANGINNVEFFSATVEKFIHSIEKVDVAILNPPRKGCETIVLEKLCEKRVQKILYVSCDPATLARDLKFLQTRGYRIEKVEPFDMFPQTAHVETLALIMPIDPQADA